MEYIILIVVLIGFAGLAFYLKQPIAKDIDQIELKDVRISLLEKEAAQKDLNISNLNKQLEIAAAKADDFEQIKIEKVRTEERLKLVETERNVLKNETISFQKAEEGRQKEESDIYERIDFIKNEISKISELGMDEMAEIKEAKKILNDSLENEKAKLNAMFKTKNVEVHEASDADYVPGEIKMSVKTYKPGTKVQVNAGQFTEAGAKDMINIILPSNEVIEVQKKYLSVEL